MNQKLQSNIYEMMIAIMLVGIGISWSKSLFFESEGINPRNVGSIIFADRKEYLLLIIFKIRFLTPILFMITIAHCLFPVTGSKNCQSYQRRIASRFTSLAVVAIVIGEAVQAFLRTARSFVYLGFKSDVVIHRYHFVWWRELLPNINPGKIGFIILGVRLMMLIVRMCHTEYSWSDRVGRFIAYSWILWAFLDSFLSLR